MFQRALWLFFILLVITVSSMTYQMLYTPSEDFQTYKELTESSDPTLAAIPGDPNRGQQFRENVEKNLWLVKENERLHTKAHAEESVLFYSLKGDSIHLVESLKKVRVLNQESLHYTLPDGRIAERQENGRLLIKDADPKDHDSWLPAKTDYAGQAQELRQIDAREAQYYYSDRVLTAEGVTLSHFSHPGHAITPVTENAEILMQGTAESIEFSFLEGDLEFHADHFSATIYSDHGLL